MPHLISRLSYTSCDANPEQIPILSYFRYVFAQYGRLLTRGQIAMLIIRLEKHKTDLFSVTFSNICVFSIPFIRRPFISVYLNYCLLTCTFIVVLLFFKMSWKCFPPNSVFVFYKIPSCVSGLFKNTWSLQTMWKGREHFCVLCFLCSVKVFSVFICFHLKISLFSFVFYWCNLDILDKQNELIWTEFLKGDC